MWARLLKEFRGIRWEVMLGALFCGVTTFNQSRASLFFLLLLTTYLAARLYAMEYSLQTMDLLAAQPISRRRLWYEKLLVLLGAALMILGAMFVGYEAFIWMEMQELSFMRLLDYLDIITLGVCLLISSISGCLFFSTWLKNMLAAFGFTFISIFVLFISSVYMTKTWLNLIPDGTEIILAPEAMLFTIVPFSIYSGVLYLLACYKYQHYESTGNAQKSLDLVALFTKPLRLNENIANMARKNATIYPLSRFSLSGQLFFKELALHQVSWLLFGICVAIYILGAFFFNPNDPNSNIGKYMFWGALFISGIMLPLTIGAVSVAEERNLGLLDCQLVQPASRIRQWFIKVAGVYFIVLITAILFPRLGIWAGIKWLDLPLLDYNNTTFQESTFILSGIIGVGVATLAIYTSSLFRTPIQALLGAIAFFIIAYAAIPTMTESIIPFFVSIAFDIASFYLEWLFPYAAQIIIFQTGDLLRDIVPGHILLIGMGMLMIIVATILMVAYTNYRRQQVSWLWKGAQFIIVIVGIQFFIYLLPYPKNYWHAFPL
jgi:hypothetical protein